MAKKLIIFYGTWRYITTFTTDYHHAWLSHALTLLLCDPSQFYLLVYNCVTHVISPNPVKYTILLISKKNMTISGSSNTAMNLNAACVQKTAQLHMRTALHAFKHLHVPEDRVIFRSMSSGITSAQRQRTPSLPDNYCMFWIFNYRFMSPTEPNYGAMTNESVTK
jgi:hypothetical protein